MTTPAQHTLGPWTVDHGVLVYSETKRCFVAKVSPCGLDTVEANREREANARLIAAAPALLAALKEIMEWYTPARGFRHFDSGTIERCRTAIRAAEGQS